MRQQSPPRGAGVFGNVDWASLVVHPHPAAQDSLVTSVTVILGERPPDTREGELDHHQHVSWEMRIYEAVKTWKSIEEVPAGCPEKGEHTIRTLFQR